MLNVQMKIGAFLVEVDVESSHGNKAATWRNFYSTSRLYCIKFLQMRMDTDT